MIFTVHDRAHRAIDEHYDQQEHSGYHDSFVAGARRSSRRLCVRGFRDTSAGHSGSVHLVLTARLEVGDFGFLGVLQGDLLDVVITHRVLTCSNKMNKSSMQKTHLQKINTIFCLPFTRHG